MADRFAGKVAIVTGGSTGIGAAVAELLAVEGAQVVIASRRAPQWSHPSVQFEACDVAEEAQVSRLVDVTVGRHGRIDLLVNCAGAPSVGETPDLDTDSWRRTFAVNCDSVFFMCRAAIPHMRSSGGGSIVNVASTAGLIGDYGFSAYSASKAAVVNYTRTLALDHARDAIRVNVLCPGFIANTAMTSRLESFPDRRKAFDDAAPLGRAGTPREMANVVAFLLADESSFMTGSVVVADGGVGAQSSQPSMRRMQTS